jgi:hypothetical protein
MYPDSSLIACRQKKVESQFILARFFEMQALSFPLAGSWQIIALSPLKKYKISPGRIQTRFGLGLPWVTLEGP